MYDLCSTDLCEASSEIEAKAGAAGLSEPAGAQGDISHPLQYCSQGHPPDTFNLGTFPKGYLSPPSAIFPRQLMPLPLAYSFHHIPQYVFRETFKKINRAELSCRDWDGPLA